MRLVARHVRVLRGGDAAVEHDLDLRLPHPRGGLDGRAGAGVHARRTASPTSSWALERGLDVDAFAPRLSFFFNAHIDFFEEIAKYRAARRIWAREMRDRFGAQNERSWQMRFHTQTAGVSLTAQQPLDQHRRARRSRRWRRCSAGRSRCTRTRYDEALALPTEDAVRLALRTQQVIAHETGVVNTHRPARRLLLRRGADQPIGGGGVRAIPADRRAGRDGRGDRAGLPQREIADAAYRYQQEVEAEERVVVGVNRYRPSRGRDPDPPHRPATSSAGRSSGSAPSRRGATRRWSSSGSRPRGGRIGRGSQPDAGDRRRRPRRRHPRRDLRRLAPRLGHLARATCFLRAGRCPTEVGHQVCRRASVGRPGCGPASGVRLQSDTSSCPRRSNSSVLPRAPAARLGWRGFGRRRRR